MNALIIDDDAVVCMLTSKMLEVKGFSVVAVKSKSELDEYLESTEAITPDLIMMDMQIDEVTGPEVHAFFLDYYGVSMPKLVAMSSHTGPEIEDLFPGFSDKVDLEREFLQKPFPAAKLFETLQNLGFQLG